MMDCTVCVVNLGMKDAFDLMWQSFKAHHGDGYPLYVWDNGSKDGCDQLGRMYATKFTMGCASHGVALDKLCKTVETPYILVADNDVEFLAPVIEEMKAESAFCVSPPDRYGMGGAEYMGYPCKGQPRIDPCCALFRTEELNRLLEFTSFAFYVSPHQAKNYDTGSMLYQFALATGLTVSQPSWLWEKVHHFGGITWMSSAPEGSTERRKANERYSDIQKRLATYP